MKIIIFKKEFYHFQNVFSIFAQFALVFSAPYLVFFHQFKIKSTYSLLNHAKIYLIRIKLRTTQDILHFLFYNYFISLLLIKETHAPKN